MERLFDKIQYLLTLVGALGITNSQLTSIFMLNNYKNIYTDVIYTFLCSPMLSLF